MITDIQLPHVSGLELIEMLKADAELSSVPIMAVTAYAAQGDEERIRAAGAKSYVSKPISVLKFVGAVQELLPAAETVKLVARARDASLRTTRPRSTIRNPGRTKVTKGRARGRSAARKTLLNLRFLEVDMLAHDRIVFAKGHLLGRVAGFFLVT